MTRYVLKVYDSALGNRLRFQGYFTSEYTHDGEMQIGYDDLTNPRLKIYKSKKAAENAAKRLTGKSWWARLEAVEYDEQ